MPRIFTTIVSLAALILSGLALTPTAAADDCTNVTPPNGAGGVYSCPGGRIEVRRAGTVVATGPTSGVGWYVTSGDGSVYVAADFSCWDGWCYLSVAALPVKACQVRYNTATFQVVTCGIV